MIPGGNCKEQRKYIGIEAKAELTNWSLAPCERKEEVEHNLLSNLVTMGIKS
jgi:hypothetical protein